MSWRRGLIQCGVTSSDEAGEMSPRRAGIQQQRVHCLSSDADYTSSSEQSCDTVIYVGKNGRALSDRELTDNEGPPPPPSPPIAVVSASVIPPSSGHRPTTSVKLSDLSGMSVSYNSNSGVIVPLSTSTSGNVVASNPTLRCVVQPSLQELCQSRTADCRHGQLMKAGGENASADCSSAAAKLRKTPASRRGAPPTDDGAVERWIDGPRSAQQFPDAPVAAVVGGEDADAAAAAAAAEMWVDGPAEFQKDPNSLVESHRSPMKLRKSKCAKLYRARAAAVAAAATAADDADGDATSARALADCEQTTRKDADVCDVVGVASVAAVRQFGVDPCQTRHKGGDQTRLPVTSAADSVAVTYGKLEELNRCRGHRRSSGRKQMNQAILASFYSPDSCPPSAQSSPGRRMRPTGGQTTPAVRGGVSAGNRTAQWVRSVQVATAAAAAGVAPPPVSSFARPMSPLKSHSVDRALRGCGVDLLGGLRVWQDDSASDDAVTAVSNNSPPPDYATCVAADLERRRRHSRRLSSPTTNLDINENLQASETSGLAPKLLPISLTPIHVAGWSAPYSYSVVPVTSVETANNRTTTFGCQQPETVFDSSTWPRRQDGGSFSFAAVDVDNEVASSQCKRLHHPDGASNPQLSEEVSRSDVVDPAYCCKLLPLLNGDADSSTVPPTTTPTSLRHQCRPADKAECRNSRHSAMESCETQPAPSPTCVRLTADKDVTNWSNVPTSGADENPSSTRHSVDTVPPTSTLSKSATRLKAPSSPSKTASSPKRNRSSSGMSLLWCIHPRGSKSRSSKSSQQAGLTFPGGEATDDVDRHRRQQSSTVGMDVQRLAGDIVVGDRSTDSDRGSSLSECTPPTALDLVRRLCNGDDDASSDYWSTKASVDHLSLTAPCLSTTSNIHQTDGKLLSLQFLFFFPYTTEAVSKWDRNFSCPTRSREVASRKMEVVWGVAH